MRAETISAGLLLSHFIRNITYCMQVPAAPSESTLIQEGNRLARRPVVGRRDTNSRSRVAGMDYLSASYVDSHMIDVIAAGIEQQIARLCVTD